MTKATIVADLKYKSPKREGRGSGSKGLRNALKYFEFVRQEARVLNGQTARS